MFNKKSSLGRAVLLSALVLFLSVGFISCQRDFQDPGYVVVGDVKIYKLTESDPICGEWQGATLFMCTPDFVWATCSSGEKQDDAEGADYTMPGWTGDEYYKKGNPSIYAVYNVKDGDLNKNEGVLLFVAKTSPYGAPAVGTWYGVKFQIDENDSSKALIEGGYSEDSAYNNVASLDDAVEMFAFENTAYYSEESWNETYSGATRVAE